MGSLGATEIILIVLALILLFGGKKIPELMKGIGQGVKQFKKGLKGEDEDKDKPDGEWFTDQPAKPFFHLLLSSFLKFKS